MRRSNRKAKKLAGYWRTGIHATWFWPNGKPRGDDLDHEVYDLMVKGLRSINLKLDRIKSMPCQWTGIACEDMLRKDKIKAWSTERDGWLKELMTFAA